MKRTCGLNKYQKAARRGGEPRVDHEEIDELVRMSNSADPEERLIAAEFMCPCHVRRRIDAVWDALYRLMEDQDVRVRRAAWHTLEDGGRTDDPRLDEIAERVLLTETNRQVRLWAQQLLESRKNQDLLAFKLAGRREIKQRGKCDFCGDLNVFVERDLNTMIPTEDLSRAALICERCVKKQNAVAARR